MVEEGPNPWAGLPYGLLLAETHRASPCCGALVRLAGVPESGACTCGLSAARLAAKVEIALHPGLGVDSAWLLTLLEEGEDE